MMGMTLVLRVLFIIGAVLYLLLIMLLLKKGKLNVQYSIIWLISAVVVLLFACFPFIVAFLRNILQIETGANLVFIIAFAFVILLLLSISTVITGFAGKIKRLCQTQALLEKRVRELEKQLSEKGSTIETEI